MEHFADIAPGDAWQPEAADRYNAVNAKLRNFATRSEPVAPDTAALEPGTVRVFNPASDDISAGTPIRLVRATAQTPELGYGTEIWLRAERHPGRSGFQGVTAALIPAGGVGLVRVSGTVIVEVSGTPAEFIKFAGGNAYYTAAGGYPVLTADSVRHRALVVLGREVFAYTGYFALRDASTYTDAGALQTARVTVCDGARPQNVYAGWCDLPGASSVSGTTLTLATGGVHDILLSATYNAASSAYSNACVASVTAVSGATIRLGRAEVVSGAVVITQDWPGGEACFGERYFI